MLNAPVASSLLLVFALVAALAIVTLSWMLYAWRSPDHLKAIELHGRASGGAVRRHLTFSVIVPARHEERVIGPTLDGLANQRYQRVEIIAVVGHDDIGTQQAAEAASRRHPGRIRVVVDHSSQKSKPRALNAALGHVRGDVVAVFDAEDEVHPDLLWAVERCLQSTRADVVQSGVQLVNFWSSWYALHNALEYFFWYRSRLHLHAAVGATPLGGNTVFIRTKLLRQMGGWDSKCLTEDADLGLRISAAGGRIVVVFDPMMVTREEAPDSLAGLFRQRSRWNQGFLQVLEKPHWRLLPRPSQRLLAAFTLASPYIQAPMALLMPISLVIAFTAKVPVGLALLSWFSLIPLIATLAIEAVGLRDLARSLNRAPSVRDYARLVAGFWPYQLVLMAAAARAAWRQLTGKLNWEKTAHVGAHRVPGLEFEVSN
jgi:cellulose synthase/poly-beta-1,6-N-acetylglucosamine synthase-like glycosyltransferase